jgi:XTP/dITP diphosphohydrolase
VQKLLREMAEKVGADRHARFVCVTAMAKGGRALAVVSNSALGSIAQEPRGANGFGYDPIFYFPDIGRSFAELAPEEKNRLSHRGKAFRQIQDLFLVFPSRIP